MDYRPAEVLDALQRIIHRAADLEVRQAARVAGTGAARVDAHGRRASRLPALALVAAARCHLDTEQRRPEPASTIGIVGGELDQAEAHGTHASSAPEVARFRPGG